MVDKQGIYFNDFFDGWELNTTFNERPVVSNINKRQIWEDEAKFYFLPFLKNCYQFTRQHKLPYFSIPVSPTMMFYRDRLHLRNFMDTIHSIFFQSLELCDVIHEPIMLLVEKRFHINNPVDGGSQQLYNMLWDVDIKPDIQKCYIPAKNDNSMLSRFGYNPPPIKELYDSKWKEFHNQYFNPSFTQDSLWLTRGTLWLQDDLNFLCKKYILDDEYVQAIEDDSIGQQPKEMVDDNGNAQSGPPCNIYDIDENRVGEYHAHEQLNLSDMKDEKQKIYEKTAREFYFKVFQPKDAPDEDIELISSDSDLIDEIDDFDPIDGSGMVDSTLNFEEDEEEMNKILAFFANMPKVTGLVQGMLDIMTSLTRILPLVVDKLDDQKLKDALVKVINVTNLGLDKVLKLCRFLGIKVEKKESGAIAVMVKDRFKKNKKKQDFIDFEIDQLNKTIDALENVDENTPPLKPIHPGDIPPDLTSNNLYPQVMDNHRPHVHLADAHSLEPHIAPPCHPHPHCDPVHEFLATGQEHHPHPPKPNPPPPPPKKEEEEIDSSESKIEPPKIPSVKPEPPNVPPKGENGIK